MNIESHSSLANWLASWFPLICTCDDVFNLFDIVPLLLDVVALFHTQSKTNAHQAYCNPVTWAPVHKGAGRHRNPR